MNQVKTYIAESKIEGIGLYAAEFIPKGTLIWKFSGLDQYFTPKYLDSLNLSEIEMRYFKRYEFGKGHGYIFCSDDAKYCNHSDTPNTHGYPEQYASRDIEIGEELTCDYSTLSMNFSTDEFNVLKSFKPEEKCYCNVGPFYTCSLHKREY